MAKRVIWARTAVADRIAILEYWLRRTGSKSYSRHLDAAIRRCIKLLARFPRMGNQLPDRNERFFVIDYYLLIYSIKDESIEILYLWDSRRDPEEFPL